MSFDKCIFIKIFQLYASMFVTCNCFTKSSYISFVQQLKNVLKARFLFYICTTPNAILHSQCIKQILGEELCRYLDVIHRENLNHFMNCLMFYEMFLMLIAACMHGSRNFIQGGSKGYSSFQGETEAYFQKFYYLNLRNLNFPRGRGVQTLPPATLPMICSCAVYLK